MGLTAFGRSSRVIALLLLVVSVWTASHRRQDDAACLPVAAGEHDASKHAFAPLAPVEHEHCAVCHWIRGLKPEFSSAPITVAVLRPTGSLSAPSAFIHADPVAGPLAARAPPPALL